MTVLSHSQAVDDYLAIPYVLNVYAVEGPGGEWLCHLEYDELPGCTVEARSPIDAMDLLEQRRREIIEDRLDRGEEIPVPRPALR